jgi:hypothetical protein
VEARINPIRSETTTMLILGIILSLFAIGFFCWLLVMLAVYALPFFAGLTMAFAAYHHGYGIAAAFLIGLVAAGATLAAGQLAFAVVRTPLLRAAIALLFAAPAAVAGYHATLGVAHLVVGHGAASGILAAIGAVLIGATAWTRMAVHVAPAGGQGIAADPSSAQAAPAGHS